VQGDWIIYAEAEPEKMEESKSQIENFENYKESEQFKDMNPMMQQTITSAIQKLKIEFLVSMPFEIKQISGLFKKVNNTTATLEFSGNVFDDPTLIEKLYGMAQEKSEVIWNSQKKAIIKKVAIKQTESHKRVKSKTSEDATKNLKKVKEPTGGTKKKRSQVTIYPKSGGVVNGDLIEETDEYIKIRFMNVPVTYYKDEIKRLQK
jgi:hypothetical protein